MMTASEALAASKKKQIDVIENSIQGAIDAGKYEVEVSNILSEENKAMLIKAGYKLDSKLTMLGNEVTINWARAEEEKPITKLVRKTLTKPVKKPVKRKHA